tara:strand:+ start:165 stop:713 length:549 start_codon:yes stop_codon:yes gene_type:complete
MPTKETTEQRFHRAELALHAIARDPEGFFEVQTYLCGDIDEDKDDYVQAWINLEGTYSPDEVEAFLTSDIWPFSSLGEKPMVCENGIERSWSLERLKYGREMNSLEANFKEAKAKLRDKYSIAINYWHKINAKNKEKAIQARLLKEQQEEEELEEEYESRMQTLVEIRDSQKDEIELLRSEL